MENDQDDHFRWLLWTNDWLDSSVAVPNSPLNSTTIKNQMYACISNRFKFKCNNLINSN